MPNPGEGGDKQAMEAASGPPLSASAPAHLAGLLWGKRGGIGWVALSYLQMKPINPGPPSAPLPRAQPPPHPRTPPRSSRRRFRLSLPPPPPPCAGSPAISPARPRPLPPRRRAKSAQAHAGGGGTAEGAGRGLLEVRYNEVRYNKKITTSCTVYNTIQNSTTVWYTVRSTV